MNGDKVSKLESPFLKKTKFSHEVIDISSDSSDESNLDDINSIGYNFGSVTPIYLNKLNFEKESSRRLSFKSLFVASDQMPVEKSAWRIKNILFSSYINDIEWVIHELENSMLACESIDSILFISHNSVESIHNQFDHCNKLKTVKINTHSPHMKVPYGVFHPKFILIIFEHSFQPKKNFIRFVITSANLIKQDWELKSQSIWVQDFFLGINKQDCEFLDYLCEFLKNVLNGSKTQKFWLSKIQEFNFEDATVQLVGSVPGYFFDNKMSKWGHLRVRSLLKSIALKNPGKLNEFPNKKESIVFQFSSIGRISEKWLYKELVSSFSGTPETKLEVIFPTMEQIVNSAEGVFGGGSLPVRKEYICKPWITKLLHKWGGSVKNSTTEKAVPHIKTFLKYKIIDGIVEIIWIVQGSYNLSNAAWGQLQKDGSHFCVKNFELGVFIHMGQFEFERYLELEEEFPKFVWKRKGNYSITSSTHNNHPVENLDIPLPFKLPPERYSKNDHPWNIELIM